MKKNMLCCCIKRLILGVIQGASDGWICRDLAGMKRWYAMEGSAHVARELAVLTKCLQDSG